MKPPAIQVRRAEPGDADALQAIYTAPKAMAGTLQLPFPGVEMWRKRLAEWSADDYMLVAEADGDVVGNAGLHSMGRTARRRHAGYIGMAVRDDWHGRGVGTALMTALVDLADNWIGYRRLELTVYTDNAAALSLYLKFGFETEGTLRDYAYRDGRYVDAYTMARLRTAADAKDGDAKAGDAKAGDAKAGDAKAGDAEAGDAKAIGRKLTKTQRKRT